MALEAVRPNERGCLEGGRASIISISCISFETLLAIELLAATRVLPIDWDGVSEQREHHQHQLDTSFEALSPIFLTLRTAEQVISSSTQWTD